MMVFGLELGELATRSRAGRGTWRTGDPDPMSRRGPRRRGPCQGTSILLGGCGLCAYKARGDSPSAGASCSFWPAHVSPHRFSFAISSSSSHGQAA